MDHCPNCGLPVCAEHVRDVVFDDEFQRVSFRGRAVFLAPREYETLRLLHRALPRPVYRDWLGEQLRVEKKWAGVYVRRLRPKIAPLGLVVAEQGRVANAPAAYVLEAAPAPAAPKRARVACDRVAAE